MILRASLLYFRVGCQREEQNKLFLKMHKMLFYAMSHMGTIIYCMWRRGRHHAGTYNIANYLRALCWIIFAVYTFPHRKKKSESKKQGIPCGMHVHVFK
jgi:hypothetical protein